MNTNPLFRELVLYMIGCAVAGAALSLGSIWAYTTLIGG